MQIIQLNFSTDDADILKAVLDSYVSEITTEIADTDQYDFREDLKKRRIIINKIRNALEEQLSKKL
jgi:hypothetical protein